MTKLPSRSDGVGAEPIGRSRDGDGDGIRVRRVHRKPPLPERVYSLGARTFTGCKTDALEKGTPVHHDAILPPYLTRRVTSWLHFRSNQGGSGRITASRQSRREFHRGSIGVPEVLIILLVVLVIFGGSRLPELGKGIGKGIRNFKDATRDAGANDKE